MQQFHFRRRCFEFLSSPRTTAFDSYLYLSASGHCFPSVQLRHAVLRAPALSTLVASQVGFFLLEAFFSDAGRRGLLLPRLA